MKINSYILLILLCVSVNSFTQEKNNREIEIVFKPKSTKLSKSEKEKIRIFVEENPLDSTQTYWIHANGESRMNFKNNNDLYSKRQEKVITEMNKNLATEIIRMYSSSNYGIHIYDTLLIKICPKSQGCIAPPFPNVKK